MKENFSIIYRKDRFADNNFLRFSLQERIISLLFLLIVL